VTGQWEILETTEFAAWFEALTRKQQAAVIERANCLRERGPLLNRPLADRVHSSRHHHMKELRVSSAGAIRILFAFDPLRRAVLLWGGDKAEGSRWNEWYEVAVPIADNIFDRHLREMER